MDIIFAGGSHYDIGGFSSLLEKFNRIYVINSVSESIKCLMRSSDVLINDFFDVDCKYVFLCGYSRLISKEELSKKTFINVHGALLPKYRGMHSTFYAIMNGEKKLGITFHLVNEFIDSGDILAQYEFDYVGQNVSEINRTIDDLVKKYAGDICFRFINNEIDPKPQDDSVATFGAKRNIEDCCVDFNMENYMLRRFFKALTPTYPQPIIIINNTKYEIIGEYEIIDRNYFGPLGRVVYINDKGVWIKCKDGFIVIKELRNYDTKDTISAIDVLPIGSRLL